ncbi:hypothetical protein HPC49_29555 [Pyxidicoccus fallax]|uniref:Lipoprotein n=1 Tax=Pyxidicoccus fallax TaxID=394095 RepID=A0A848LD89_9BACT|nr:hypothetical protein [Pyxidicoccus fallax]NMO14753.1 hypothetical protein [Pyxidicoccus fallax]NPC82354.1 hypothetical protein [Pyxidicoccus fallax]
MHSVRRHPHGALVRAIVPVVVLLLSACGPESLEDDSFGASEWALAGGPESTAFRAALAKRWAPIHYQDVDVTGSHSLSGRSDYITRVNFDGDWSGTNNWENTASRPLTAAAYHSLVETSTHWYLVYTFFHPRDWSDNIFDSEHENDAEGVLLIVKRDGSEYGALVGAVTVAHKDFFSFVPDGSPLGSGAESIDGKLSLASFEGQLHPITAQEAKGHGLKAWPAYDIVGDGVKYFPSLTVSEEPSSATDSDVRYKLIDIYGSEGLWPRRGVSELFVSDGTFRGDTSGGCGLVAGQCGTNSANAPWGWDDQNDGSILRGELARDPAKLAAYYFSPASQFSTTYTFNPYAGIGGDPNTP